MEYASILGRPLAHDELQNNYVAMDCMQYNLMVMYHPRLSTGLCLQMEAGEDQQDDDDEEEMEEEEDFDDFDESDKDVEEE